MELSPDFVNGLFEFFGAFFILNHCRTLFKDKQVAGLSILSTAFFSGWALWNLYFYPNLGQWWSFVGGACLCICNFTWVGMLLYYRRWPGGKS